MTILFLITLYIYLFMKMLIRNKLVLRFYRVYSNAMIQSLIKAKRALLLNFVLSLLEPIDTIYNYFDAHLR